MDRLPRLGSAVDDRPLNTVTPTSRRGGQVQSPRLQQPYTRQASIGWRISDVGVAITADYVHVDGRT